MTRTNVFLPAEMLARLKAIKASTGVPASEFIRRAVDAALDKAGA